MTKKVMAYFAIDLQVTTGNTFYMSSSLVVRKLGGANENHEITLFFVLTISLQ